MVFSGSCGLVGRCLVGEFASRGLSMGRIGGMAKFLAHGTSRDTAVCGLRHFREHVERHQKKALIRGGLAIPIGLVLE